MGCPLGKDIIVIDDNYTGQGKQNYVAAGQKMNEVVTEYISILRKLLEEEGLSGKTAQKLSGFVDVAESLLKDTVLNWSKQTTGQMEHYVAEIDEADREIY